MNFYPWHIGDYSAHTRNLTLLEDLAYRRLLDAYYLAERPLNGCSTDVAREIGMRDQLESVEYVLSRYFVRDGDMWRNARADREIAAFQDKRDKASKAGKKSAEKRARSTDVEKNSTDVDGSANGRATNQEPRTKNQEPKYKYLPDDLVIAEEMFKKISQVVPTAKPPSYPAWANSIRLMREQDKRDPELIRAVFAFANTDQFWSVNILSPDTLRKQFDKLNARRAQPRASPVIPIKQTRHTDFEKIDYTAGVNPDGSF